jgi:signal transduction histidine kinase/DNA-binding response OmpR family regulator/HPt (histidine-containing phosphotransfer) domain-containing protein
VEGPGIFWSELERLFTLVGQIDNTGRLVRASPLLARYVEVGQHDGCQFFETFKFKRPTPFDGTYGAAEKAAGQLFLGFSEELGFAIRGQVVDYSALGISGLCFVGVPWLWWIEGNAQDKALTMSDFPVHDVQMDQLFFMTTQQSMVEDLQALNEQLGVAREEVERVNEARQRYFHHVSHEMRTPLNGVISSLGLMRDYPLHAKVEEYADLAAQSAQRLLEVINFTLETASLESHMADAEIESFSLDQVLDECLSLAKPKALEKGLRLCRSNEGVTSGQYRGRLKLLRQVLANLMSNAVKFCPDGEITLGTKNLGESPEGDVLFEVYVQDQGPGIPVAAQAVLFEPFATGLSEDTRDSGGTGLGLNIVQRFVEELGGEIQVDSAPGSGARFYFTLPLAYVGEASVSRAEVAAEPVGEITGHLLLVDDIHTNRLLNSKQLESMGFQVTTATSGKEALKLLESRETPFDLVLMDLDMPEMDGFETTRRLRKIPAFHSLPVVALTALSAASDRERALEAGMVGFLCKPFDQEQVRGVLAGLLSGQSSEKAVSDSAAAEVANGRVLIDEEMPKEGVSATYEQAATNTDGAVAFACEPIDELTKEVGLSVAKTLVEKFLQESSERWEALRAAIAEQDKDAAVRESHTLGSACLTFGLLSSGGAFRRIEASALSGDLPLESDLTTLTQDLGEGIVALRAHLASAAA